MQQAEDMPRRAAGTVLMVLGVAMLAYDSTQDWDTIWATAIGIKLIVVAIIFLAWGPLRRLDERSSPKN
jgi:protein-S-isoprenylcysteine O-methyltransferase Ste14